MNELDSMVVARINGVEITRGDLLAAFNLVADPANWKNPIDALVPYEKCATLPGYDAPAVIRTAVAFFAGCDATTMHLGAGIRVIAVGYYVAVGA
jgi:hypothetical protein